MNLKQWSKKLLASLIQGGSHAGGAYLGLAIAHSADAAIPALNLKGLCVIIVSSALLKLFNFLESNPIPDDDVTITTVQATKTTVVHNTPPETIETEKLPLK